MIAEHHGVDDGYLPANEYLDKQRDTLEKRRERLAAAVDAGRQAYRDDKEKM